MKKFISIYLVILMLPVFFACSVKDTVTSYESNEKTNYITDKTFNGGKDTNNKKITLDKIWINDLIGDTKIIFNFGNTEKIPKYTVYYKDKKIYLTLTNIKTSNTKISNNYKKNDLIKNIQITSKDDKSIVIVSLNSSIKYRTDETIDARQLVLNLRN